MYVKLGISATDWDKDRVASNAIVRVKKPLFKQLWQILRWYNLLGQYECHRKKKVIKPHMASDLIFIMSPDTELLIVNPKIRLCMSN